MGTVTRREKLPCQEIAADPIPCCPICADQGSILYENMHDRIYDVPGIWTILRCASCGCLWLSPRPHPTEVPKLYGEYYTHVGTRDNSSGQAQYPRIWSRISDYLLIGRSAERQAHAARLICPPHTGRLLDVGCGNGSYLAQMRERGWSVFGSEVDPRAAQVAREIFALDVAVGLFEATEFPANYFDVITLNHVIEHCADPQRTLRRCFDLLKPGGRLSLITPNTKSLGHRMFGSAWYHLDPPRHLVLFSPDLLIRVVERCGFRTVAVSTSSLTANSSFGASEWIRVGGKVADPDWSRIQKLWGRARRATCVLSEHYGNLVFRHLGEDLAVLAVKDGPDAG